MLLRFPGFLSKKDKRVPAPIGGPYRVCEVPPLAAASATILAASLILGAIAGLGSSEGLLVPSAHAQPTREDVEKFKKDAQKFGKDVEQKFHTLIEKLR